MSLCWASGAHWNHNLGLSILASGTRRRSNTLQQKSISRADGHHYAMAAELI